MEKSSVPVRKWVFAMYLMMSSKVSISSVKLGEYIGVKQPTAWAMMHRIRQSMLPEAEPMEGTVEVDETFVGGREPLMHRSRARTKPPKTVVIGAMCRETGEVRCRVIPGQMKGDMERFVRDTVAVGSAVYTDEAPGYNGLRGMGYRHGQVEHKIKEYVNLVDPDIHTQGIESHWQWIKRAHKGTHHWWSPKYTQRYANELSFRATHRKLDAHGRMALVALRSSGSRLPLAQLAA